MPGDVQLVVVVADEGVKPDPLLCALDLQRSGGVRWTERKHAAKTIHLHAEMYCECEDHLGLKILPITLKTWFIRSLNPEKDQLKD